MILDSYNGTRHNTRLTTRTMATTTIRLILTKEASKMIANLVFALAFVVVVVLTRKVGSKSLELSRQAVN